MALRSILYLLGASLTVVSCFFPWSCCQVGDLSWRCTTAIVLRYSMQDHGINRFEIHDNVRGSGFIILSLTVIIQPFIGAFLHFLPMEQQIIGAGSMFLLVPIVWLPTTDN